MGLPKFKELEILGEILSRARYRPGEEGQIDLVVTHIRMLLEKSDESYMQGAADGFIMGQIKPLFPVLGETSQETAKNEEK